VSYTPKKKLGHSALIVSSSRLQVWQTLLPSCKHFVDENITSQYLLDAVVTMVDAKHADLQLDEHHEAQVQVAFADRILITKRAKSSLASGRD